LYSSLDLLYYSDEVREGEVALGYENLKGRYGLVNIGLHERIILNWILNIYYVKVWTDSTGSELSPVARCCEHCNQISGSIKGGQFLDHITYCHLLMKDSAACN
jgi:hypothetical protein